MWMHGAFDAGRLVLGNVVVATCLQYRLGVTGFLALQELAEEEPYSTVNYGMRDQRAALRMWSLAAYVPGSDLGRVIVWGGWADGAVSACYHMLSLASTDKVAGIVIIIGRSRPDTLRNPDVRGGIRRDRRPECRRSREAGPEGR